MMAALDRIEIDHVVRRVIDLARVELPCPPARE